MLEPSSPPPWIRPLTLSVADLSPAYFGPAERRLSDASLAPGRRRAWSDAIHSQRTLQALKDLGVTAVCLHCDEGLGHAAQADDTRHARALAAACHDLGLRVFARVEAGRLGYETLLTDRPALAACAQRDPRGGVVPAQSALPSWRPCYRSRGFVELLKDSLTVAAEDVGADGVLLSAFGPQECHCERCQQGFRRRLAARHLDPRETFGLPSFDHVRLPVAWSAADPLAAEAACYRTESICAALGELRIHLRSLSSQLALWAAPRLGEQSLSLAALWQVCTAVDILSLDEAGSCPALRARAHLVGRATQTAVHVPCHGAATADMARSIGAAAAFGGHVLAADQALEGPTDGRLMPRFVADSELCGLWQRSLEFAGRHAHYHHREESLAEVAVAFSIADVGLPTGDHAEALAAEEALLEAGIPFDLVPVEMVDPARYRVVVLAGQRRCTDAEVERLAVLTRGSMALAVGDSLRQDPLGRPRSEGCPSVARVGLAELANVVDRALGPAPVVRIVAPRDRSPGVHVCVYRLPTGQAALHLVNTGPGPAEGLRLHIRADLAPTRHVALHVPEAADTLLDSVSDGEAVATALPLLRSYALVVTS